MEDSKDDIHTNVDNEDKTSSDPSYENDEYIYILWHCKNSDGYQQFETNDISTAEQKWNALTEHQGTMIQNKKILKSKFENDLWKTNIYNFASFVIQKQDKDYNIKQLSNAINLGIFLLQELLTQYKVNIIDPSQLKMVKHKQESLGSGYQTEWVKLRYWNTHKMNIALKNVSIDNSWHNNRKGYINGVKYQLKIIQNELNVLRDIKHNNIMSFFGSFISDDGQCINHVCELLGIRLFVFVQKDYDHWKHNDKDEYPPKSYRKAFSALSDGIQTFHDAGYVHRDLHKLNILIRSADDDGAFDFVLIDFGLSLRCDENQTFQKGSERHYSPESAGTDVYTTKSDVFSFGTVLYEILNGGEDIFGDNVEYNDSIQLIQQYKMPNLEDIQCNAMYKQAIAQCWIQNPKERVTARECSRILVLSSET